MSEQNEFESEIAEFGAQYPEVEGAKLAREVVAEGGTLHDLLHRIVAARQEEAKPEIDVDALLDTNSTELDEVDGVRGLCIRRLEFAEKTTLNAAIQAVSGDQTKSNFLYLDAYARRPSGEKLPQIATAEAFAKLNEDAALKLVRVVQAAVGKRQREAGNVSGTTGSSG